MIVLIMVALVGVDMVVLLMNIVTVVIAAAVVVKI